MNNNINSNIEQSASAWKPIKTPKTEKKNVESAQIKPKWNSLLQIDESPIDVTLLIEPQLQPNRRNRSESMPNVRQGLSSSFVEGTLEQRLQDLDPMWANKDAEQNGLNDHQDQVMKSSLLFRRVPGDAKAFANGVEAEAMNEMFGSADTNDLGFSPLRSPVVADWKIVGSPAASSMNIMESALDCDEITIGSGLSSVASVLKGRQRATSLVERSFKELSMDTSPLAGSFEENLNSANRSGSLTQVAQLPSSLQEELGLGSAEDTMGMFQKELLLDKDAYKIPKSAMEVASHKKIDDFFVSLAYLNMSDGSMSANDPKMRAPMSALPLGAGSRRSSSWLEWPTDFCHQDSDMDHHFVDSIFSPNSLISGRHSATPNGRRYYSRRHSIPDASILESTFNSANMPDEEEANYGMEYGQENAAGTDYYSIHLGDPSASRSSLAEAAFQLSTYRGPLWAVEFKAGRTEIFYVSENDGKPQIRVRVGDLVIVEADRGEDLGKVTAEISISRLKQLMSGSRESSGSSTPSGNDTDGQNSVEASLLLSSKEIIPKRIHRLAQATDLKLLQAKAQEEALAMVRCQSRIRQKKLPMEVVDAEYQWDRNKLTFYFCADRRIDFRELVRDLFRIYKTRIWMCAVDKSSPRMHSFMSGIHNGAEEYGDSGMC